MIIFFLFRLLRNNYKEERIKTESTRKYLAVTEAPWDLDHVKNLFGCIQPQCIIEIHKFLRPGGIISYDHLFSSNTGCKEAQKKPST